MEGFVAGTLHRGTRLRAVWALSWVLLLAQTLAILHGPLHGLEAARETVVASVDGRAGPVAAASLGGHESEASGLHALFGHHSADADCRLLDQLAQGLGPLPVEPAPLSVAPNSAPDPLVRSTARPAEPALRPPARAPSLIA